MNKSATNLLSIEAAVAQLKQYAVAKNKPAVEDVELCRADGAVLAQDLYAPINVAAFDNSAMDGYAVNSADLTHSGVVLPISQRIVAGAQAAPLQPHTAARIFTGAMMPSGADTVVMQENTTASADEVTIHTLVKSGAAVRKCGEDIQRGALLLAKGTQLMPAHIGLAASVGYGKLPVYRRLKVALLCSGDELVTPGSIAAENLAPGCIFNSNFYQIHGILTRWNCEVLAPLQLKDDLTATEEVLIQAARQADLIITTGGVSVGEEDHLKQAISNQGRLNLWRVAIRPGKPFAFGEITAHNKVVPLIGLPGNPVSAHLTLLVLGRDFIKILQGASHYPAAPAGRYQTIHAITKSDKKRTEYLRASLKDGKLEIYASQSSAVLTSIAATDGLIVNPQGNLIMAGDEVEFISYAALLA